MRKDIRVLLAKYGEQIDELEQIREMLKEAELTINERGDEYEVEFDDERWVQLEFGKLKED